jgi:uncharacterized protein with HEPN domain
MKDEVKKYLFDIKNSMAAINSFLGKKRNFFAYQNDLMLKRAIERELGIIGEAVNKINKFDSNIIINNAHKIIGLRNLIIHNYDNIDDEIIWGIVNRDLPILFKEIDTLLNTD